MKALFAPRNLREVPRLSFHNIKRNETGLMTSATNLWVNPDPERILICLPICGLQWLFHHS